VSGALRSAATGSECLLAMLVGLHSDESVRRAVSAASREERCLLASTRLSNACGACPIELTHGCCSGAADTPHYARRVVVQNGSPRASADALSGDLDAWPSRCRSMPQPLAASTTRCISLTGVGVVGMELWVGHVGCTVRLPVAIARSVQSDRRGRSEVDFASRANAQCM
jgi:hypothetical protein